MDIIFEEEVIFILTNCNNYVWYQTYQGDYFISYINV